MLLALPRRASPATHDFKSRCLDKAINLLQPVVDEETFVALFASNPLFPCSLFHADVKRVTGAQHAVKLRKRLGNPRAWQVQQ